MYFWKIKNLESDLSTGSLSQSDKYKYLLSFMIITAIFGVLSLYISYFPTFTRLSESSAVILFTILGTMYCYKVNRQ
jgi:hypothetical protein